MNRRAFFASLLGGTAAAAIDPERLLWTPGARLISIPPARVELVSSQLERVTVREFHNLKTGDVITFYGDWKTYVVRSAVSSVSFGQLLAGPLGESSAMWSAMTR
jgi:hypothetical protein